MKASPILANVSPVVASPVVASPLVPCFPDRLGKTEATKGQRATKGQYLLSTYRPLVAPRGVIPYNILLRVLNFKHFTLGRESLN